MSLLRSLEGLLHHLLHVGRLGELYLVIEDDITLHQRFAELLPCAVDAVKAVHASWRSIRFDCFSRFMYLNKIAMRPRSRFSHDGPLNCLCHQCVG